MCPFSKANTEVMFGTNASLAVLFNRKILIKIKLAINIFLLGDSNNGLQIGYLSHTISHILLSLIREELCAMLPPPC